MMTALCVGTCRFCPSGYVTADGDAPKKLWGMGAEVMLVVVSSDDTYFGRVFIIEFM